MEAECQEVQDQLLQLKLSRDALQEEFSQLGESNRQLWQQLYNDSFSSEGQVHAYESEKKRLEVKLEELEELLREKDGKINELDAKASEYLLQVTTTSNSLFDDEDDDEDDEAAALTAAMLLKKYDSLVSDSTTPSDSSDDEQSSQRILTTKYATNSYQIVDVLPADTVTCVLESSDSITAQDVSSKIDKCEDDNADKSIDDNVIAEDKTRNEVDLNVELDNAVECYSSNSLEIDNNKADNLTEKDNTDVAVENHNKDSNVEENLMNKPKVDTKSDAVVEIPVVNENAEKVDELVKTDGITTGEKSSDGFNITTKTENTDEVIDSTVNIADESVDANSKTDNPPEIDELGSNIEIGKISSSLESGDTVVSGGVDSNGVKDVNNILNVVDNQPQLAGDANNVRPNLEKEHSRETRKESESNVLEKHSKEEILSLSSLLSELRQVKDDMGRCMSVKEGSFTNLEEKLLSTNREVSSLRDSMILLSTSLQEKERSYQSLEHDSFTTKVELEKKLAELQQITTTCSLLKEEKEEIVNKVQVLESMTAEYRSEIENLVTDKCQTEDEIDSAKGSDMSSDEEAPNTSTLLPDIIRLEGKVKTLEKEKKTYGQKLKASIKHLKALAREREHKQEECELLQKKVEMVELKMCELQGTFDALVKAILGERDQLINEVNDRNSQIEELSDSMRILRSNHSKEIDQVLEEKLQIEKERNQYKSGELQNIHVESLDNLKVLEISQENEDLKQKLQSKTEEADALLNKASDEQVEIPQTLNNEKYEEICRENEDLKQKLRSKTDEADVLLEKVSTGESVAPQALINKQYEEIKKENEELKQKLQSKTEEAEALLKKPSDEQVQSPQTLNNEKYEEICRENIDLKQKLQSKTDEADVLLEKVSTGESVAPQALTNKQYEEINKENEELKQKLQSKTEEADVLLQKVSTGESASPQALNNEQYKEINKENDDLKQKLQNMTEEANELLAKVIAIGESTVNKEQYEEICRNNEDLKQKLQSKTEEADVLQGQILNINGEMSNFVAYLKDEIINVKAETAKTKLEKQGVEQSLSDLQKEHSELTAKNEVLDQSTVELDKANKEKLENIEILKVQLDDLQQQFDDLNTKNFSLSSELLCKEDEYKEELNAREATIQELRVTLTNNQKQSMENYHALQDDMAALQIRLGKDLEDSRNLAKNWEDKCKLVEEDSKKEIEELKAKLKALEEKDNNTPLESKAINTETEKEKESVESNSDSETDEEPPECADFTCQATEESQESKIISHPKRIPKAKKELEAQDVSNADQNSESVLDDKANSDSVILQVEEHPKIDDMMKSELPDEPLTSNNEQFEQLSKEKEELQQKLQNKTEEADALLSKLNTLQFEMTNFVSYLKDEIVQLKQDAEKSKLEKQSIDQNLSELQKDKLELIAKNEELEQFKTETQQAMSTNSGGNQPQAETTNSEEVNPQSQSQVEEELQSKSEIDSEKLELIKVSETSQQKAKEASNEEASKGESAQPIGELQSMEGTEDPPKSNSSEDMSQGLRTLNKSLDLAISASSQPKSSEEADIATDDQILLLDQQIFKSQEEFEKVMKIKESKIKELEIKVNNLEQSLANKSTYIFELEKKIEKRSSVNSYENLAENGPENHLQEIDKLSHEISELKNELEDSNCQCTTLKTTIDSLEIEKSILEKDRAKLKSECDLQAQHTSTISLEIESEETVLERLEPKKIEKKKKSKATKLESQSEQVSDSNVKSIEKQSIEADNIDLKDENQSTDDKKKNLDKQKLESDNKLESSEVKGRLVEVGRIKDSKIIALDVKYLNKIGEIKNEIDTLLNEYISGNCKDIEVEKQLLKKTVESLEEKLISIQCDQKHYEEEKQKLKDAYEEEQNKALEMQNEMVNDLEKLILSLESEKSDLGKSVEELKNSNEDLTGQLSDFERRIFILDNRIISVDREKSHLKEENVKLRSIIETESDNASDLEGGRSLKMMDDLIVQVRDLQLKLDESQISLEHQEQIYGEKLNEVKEEYSKQVISLRHDMTEEIDILEQSKDDVETDLEDKMVKLQADYEEQILIFQQQCESRLSEEKAEFGRVLVTKIDEYEKRLSEKKDEVSGYQIRLENLQKDFEDKLSTIGELETNLADLSYIRLGLEKEVRDLKLTMTQLKKTEPGSETQLREMRNQYEDRLHRLHSERHAQVSDHEGQMKKAHGTMLHPNTPEVTYWPNPTSAHSAVCPGASVSGRNTPTSTLSRSSSASSVKVPSSPSSGSRSES